MIYSLLVLSSPLSGQCARNAVEFAHAVIARGHSLHRIFFLDAGTACGSSMSVCPQDEESPLQRWQHLAEAYNVDLVLCIASALRYGVLDQLEAKRYERPLPTIDPVFTISGLGQLVDACANSDRVITFGG